MGLDTRWYCVLPTVWKIGPPPFPGISFLARRNLPNSSNKNYPFWNKDAALLQVRHSENTNAKTNDQPTRENCCTIVAIELCTGPYFNIFRNDGVFLPIHSKQLLIITWTTIMESVRIRLGKASYCTRHMETLRQFLDNYETILRHLWDNFKTKLGQLWDSFETTLGSHRDDI